MKTKQQKIKYIAWWYSQWREANGVPGDANSDWAWASAAFTDFPVVAWAPGQVRVRNERLTDNNGRCQIVTAGGLSGAQVPVWNRNGGVTTDGTVAWLDMGTAAPW